MKLLILTVLALFIPLLQMPEEADLKVVKFSWSKYRQSSDLIHGADDPGPSMNEPVAVLQPERKNEPAEVKNRRDIQQRRADMANAERNANNSAARRQDYYSLRLEVKNVGQNTTKSIVWEFQPTVQTAVEARQYICKMKAKPNENKVFELMSPSPPVKVVSADKKALEGKVVINRIEYADGSVWKRKGWSVLIPAELTDQMENGKCVMF